MNLTFQQIVLTGVVSIISAVIMWILNRKYNKAQTANNKAQAENFVTEAYHKLTADLLSERDKVESRLEEYRKRIEQNEKEISDLKKQDKDKTDEIRMLKEDNDECKYLHEVAELEMRQIKRFTDVQGWKRTMIYVLDDDEDILDDFKHRFNRLSVLEFEGFHDVESFLEKARVHQPSIIVLDYLLNKGLTAEDVIDGIGYLPEIFIMSGERKFANNFGFDRVRFFEKDDNFILKIVKAIIQYLISKN